MCEIVKARCMQTSVAKFAFFLHLARYVEGKCFASPPPPYHPTGRGLSLDTVFFLYPAHCFPLISLLVLLGLSFPEAWRNGDSIRGSPGQAWPVKVPPRNDKRCAPISYAGGASERSHAVGPRGEIAVLGTPSAAQTGSTPESWLHGGIRAVW